MDSDKEKTLTPTAQEAIGDAARANVNAAVEVAKSAVGSFVGALTGERKKSTPLGEAQERRGRFLRELPASGVRRSVPVLADGLLLPQAEEVRKNLRAVGERRSSLAQGELAPPLRPAGPHGRPVLASVLEGALKRSEAPRNPRPPKVAVEQPSAAQAENET